MGILDDILGNLFPDDPRKAALNATAFGLLGGSGKTNKNFGADLMNAGLLGANTYAQGKQLQLKNEADQRANRASDLQQLQGAYSMLKQQEFGKMLAAEQAGQQYSPNPMLPQMEARLAELTGLGNMATSGPAAATGGSQSAPRTAPQTAPAVGPPVGPQMSTPQNPQFNVPLPQIAPTELPRQQSAMGGPAGGIPMKWWLAQDPTGTSYIKQLAEDNKPIVLRQADLVKRNPDGSYSSAYQQPQLDKGILPTRDNNGQVTGSSDIPGYSDALSRIESAKAAAKASGGLPYQPPNVINTPGAPRLMTPIQAITAATGQPPPSPFATVTPHAQAGMNDKRVAILQQELSQETDPKNRAAIQTELAAMQGAQARGDPFSSQRPAAPQPATSQPQGLPLQDQTSSAAQRELGTKIGGQAADTFTNMAASVQGKRLLAGMSDMAQSYTPGAFQPMRAKLAQYATGLGLDEDTANKILSTNAGDIQGLTSAAISMAGKLTRQTDAQPSQLQFMKTLESMPSAGRSKEGFARIMDYLNSMHDYNIEKGIGLQQWLNDPKNAGDPSGFEAAWAEKSKNMPFVWNRKPAGDPLVVTAPDGSTHRFPSPQLAEAFRKRIGQQ